MELVNIFQFYRLPPFQNDCALCLIEAFWFHEVHLLIALLVFCSESLLWCQCVQGYSPTFSSIWWSISGFMLKSLIHFDLSFVKYERYVSIFILLHANIQFYQHHLLKILSFPVCFSGFFFKNMLCIYVWFFNLIPLINLSVFYNTMEVLLLYLCSMPWNQEWWLLQQLFYCSGFFFKYPGFCVSVWSWELSFQGL